MDQPPGSPIDEYLVLLSQAGSTDAMDGLARRWTPRLLRYAARVIGGADAPERARDVVQETWVGAIRGLRGLRDPSQFSSWIYGIATRKCVDAIRAETRRRRLDAKAADVGAERPVTGLTAEQQVDLAAAIRELPPIHRAAVHLFYVEDVSVEGIASVLGIPAGTVKSRLHHAREALKQQMGAGARRTEAEADKQEIS